MDVKKYNIFIQGLLQGVLLEFLHPMCFVDRMLMTTGKFQEKVCEAVLKNKDCWQRIIHLCNLTLEVEREVSMNYNNVEQVLEDNEMMDTDGTNCKEAPCDADIVMLDVVIPNIGIPGVV
jgi:hypothetical protein